MVFFASLFLLDLFVSLVDSESRNTICHFNWCVYTLSIFSLLVILR